MNSVAFGAAGRDAVRAGPGATGTNDAHVCHLDGWRGLAILGVLIDHFFIKRGINFGRLGVELFFVLSGRLMAEILFVRQTPLPNFFARRVSRIYPALLLVAVCVAAAGAATGSTDPTPGQFLSTFTFTANYTRLWIGGSKMLGHVWSLCIEEHMYVLLAVVSLAWRWWKFPPVLVLSALALAFMLSGAVQTALGLSYETVYWRSDARGASILVGAITYLLLHRDVPRRLRGHWMPLVLGMLGFALSFKIIPDPIKYSLGTTCLAASLVFMNRAPAFALSILEHPLLVRLGIWSYSIYLWQQPFFRVATDLHIPRWQLLPLAAATALASFYGVEQPARRWLNARWHTRRDVVTG